MLKLLCFVATLLAAAITSCTTQAQVECINSINGNGRVHQPSPATLNLFNSFQDVGTFIKSPGNPNFSNKAHSDHCDDAAVEMNRVLAQMGTSLTFRCEHKPGTLFLTKFLVGSGSRCAVDDIINIFTHLLPCKLDSACTLTSSSTTTTTTATSTRPATTANLGNTPLPPNTALVLVADVTGTTVANDAYWAEACETIPDTARGIAVDMGSVRDFFRPIAGATFCEMLQSGNKHEWSNNGENWVEGVTYETHKPTNGGSRLGWNSADARNTIAFWGTDEISAGWTRDGQSVVGPVTGGCCSTSPNVKDQGWGRPFTLSYFHQEVPPFTCKLADFDGAFKSWLTWVGAPLFRVMSSGKDGDAVIHAARDQCTSIVKQWNDEIGTGFTCNGMHVYVPGLSACHADAKKLSTLLSIPIGCRPSGTVVPIYLEDCANSVHQVNAYFGYPAPSPTCDPTHPNAKGMAVCNAVSAALAGNRCKDSVPAVTSTGSAAQAASPEECAALVAGDGGCAGNTATFQYNAGTGACHCVPQDCPRFRYRHNERDILNSLASEDASWTIYNRFDVTATPSKRYHFEHKTPTARVGAAGAWIAAEGYGEWDGKPAVVAEPPLSATEVSEWTMKILYTPAELEDTHHNLAFNLFYFGIFVGKDLPITDMNTRKRDAEVQGTHFMYGKGYPFETSYEWDGSYMLSDPDKLIVGNGDNTNNGYEYWEMPYGMESMGSDKSKWKYTPMYQTGDEVRFRFDPAAGHCSIVVVRGNVTYFAGAFMLKAEHVGKPVRISMFVNSVGNDGNNGAAMITDTPKAPPCDPNHPNAKGMAACNAVSVALAGKRCKDSIAAVTGSTGSGALAASPEECAALVAGDGGCASNTATFQYNAVSGACHCLPQGCYPSQVVDSENVCTDLSAKYQCPPHRNDWSIYNRFDVTAVPSHTYSFKHKTPSAQISPNGLSASLFKPDTNGVTKSFLQGVPGSATIIAEPAFSLVDVSECAIKLLSSPGLPTSAFDLFAFGIFAGDLPIPNMNVLSRDSGSGRVGTYDTCSYKAEYPYCQSHSWDGAYLLWRDGKMMVGEGSCPSNAEGCYSNPNPKYSPLLMDSRGNGTPKYKQVFIAGDEIRFRFDPVIGRCTMLVLRGDDTFNAGVLTLKQEHLGKPVRLHIYTSDGYEFDKWISSKTGAVMIADVAPPTVADIPNNAGVKPVVGLLARVGSATKADSAFWEAECQRLPPTTQYIIVMMGAVFDYFKPIDGETSFCDMLTSNDKHLWSPNGVDWQQPTYANAAQGSGKVLGGSSDAWPRVNVGNDERDLLSMWGYMDGAERGGCCSRSKKVASTTGHNGGTDAWAQDFDMWYVDLKTSTTTSTTIATNAETVNPTPATATANNTPDAGDDSTATNAEAANPTPATTTANTTPDAGDNPTTQVGLGGSGSGDKDTDDGSTTGESEHTKSNGGTIAGGIVAALVLIAIVGYVIRRKYLHRQRDRKYRKSSTFDAQLASMVALGLIHPEDDASATAVTSDQSKVNGSSAGAGSADLDTNEYLAPTPIKNVSNPVFEAQNEYTDFDEGANADVAVAAENGASSATANPVTYDLASGESNVAASPVKLDLASGAGKEEAFDGFAESGDDGYLHVQSGTADSLRDLAETHSVLKSVEEKKGPKSDAPARKVPLVVARDTVFELENLGEGHFGTVSKGLLDQSSIGGAPECLVAIKAVKSSAPAIETTKLMEEAVLMAQVSGHENIVSVVGIVTGDDGGPVMLLVTYCEHGSLDHYLKKRAGEPPQWKADICIGIARGMAHLSDCGFVHRDLAARNILIDSRKRPRVADFGMSRDGGDAGDDDDNVYQGSNGGALPIRWTAPESFMTHTFNTASDVWSFGVLLLEVYTDAARPYAELRNNEVILKLTQGYRAPQPPSCPVQSYVIMQKCWAADPQARPGFEAIVEALSHEPTVSGAPEEDDGDGDYVVPNSAASKGKQEESFDGFNA